MIRVLKTAFRTSPDNRDRLFACTRQDALHITPRLWTANERPDCRAFKPKKAAIGESRSKNRYPVPSIRKRSCFKNILRQATAPSKQQNSRLGGTAIDGNDPDSNEIQFQATKENMIRSVEVTGIQPK